MLWWASQDTTDTTGGPKPHWSVTDHLPLLGSSKKIRCVGCHSVAPSSSGSISALPFPRARRKDLSYTDEHTSLFASAWHWTHRAWTPVHDVHNQETMVACKAAALVNTTWDTTSSRDSSLRLTTWLPHLLVSQICLCWMMQITIQMLGIQLGVRITKSTGTVSSSVLFAMKLFWRDLCPGSMTVKGIQRQRAWDPVSRHGVKKQNKNNLCGR